MKRKIPYATLVIFYLGPLSGHAEGWLETKLLEVCSEANGSRAVAELCEGVQLAQAFPEQERCEPFLTCGTRCVSGARICRTYFPCEQRHSPEVQYLPCTDPTTDSRKFPEFPQSFPSQPQFPQSFPEPPQRVVPKPNVDPPPPLPPDPSGFTPKRMNGAPPSIGQPGGGPRGPAAPPGIPGGSGGFGGPR